MWWKCCGVIWQSSEIVLQEVTEEDERLLSMFMASDAAPQRTLADIIMERINEKGGDDIAVAAEVEG
jgi:hypothetical protein